MEEFLKTTHFVNFDHVAIKECIYKLDISALPLKERAIKLFYFVRNEIEYEFMAKMTDAEYIASNVLAAGRGFCVQKAVLLCALGREAGIPTALVLSDLRDHTLPEKVVKALGTDVMYHHGLNAFFLEGRWIKVDASLTETLLAKKNLSCTDFDGEREALLPAETPDGKQHCEYLRFHGMYSDLPFRQMIDAFVEFYSKVDIDTMTKMNSSRNADRNGL